MIPRGCNEASEWPSWPKKSYAKGHKKRGRPSDENSPPNAHAVHPQQAWVDGARPARDPPKLIKALRIVGYKLEPNHERNSRLLSIGANTSAGAAQLNLGCEMFYVEGEYRCARSRAAAYYGYEWVFVEELWEALDPDQEKDQEELEAMVGAMWRCVRAPFRPWTVSSLNAGNPKIWALRFEDGEKAEELFALMRDPAEEKDDA